jgi:hypothetical protein
MHADDESLQVRDMRQYIIRMNHVGSVILAAQPFGHGQPEEFI